MDEFKITIAAARVNAGLKQADVARELHVGKQTVVSWEKGYTSPTIEMAQRFCELCNIPIDRVTFLRERNAI